LKTLKRHLFAEQLRTEITWDPQILDLSKGVADAMAGYCNRLFPRVAGDEFTCNGERNHAPSPPAADCGPNARRRGIWRHVPRERFG
jgi:hypothetical protein